MTPNCAANFSSGSAAYLPVDPVVVEAMQREVAVACVELNAHVANVFGADSAAHLEACERAGSLNKKVLTAVRYLFRAMGGRR